MRGEHTNSSLLSQGETTTDKMRRSQPLKLCDVCAKPADPQGGVEIKTKWYCAKCWTRRLNRK